MDQGEYWKLKKALYGLKQGGSLQNQNLSGHLPMTASMYYIKTIKSYNSCLC